MPILSEEFKNHFNGLSLSTYLSLKSISKKNILKLKEKRVNRFYEVEFNPNCNSMEEIEEDIVKQIIKQVTFNDDYNSSVIEYKDSIEIIFNDKNVSKRYIESLVLSNFTERTGVEVKFMEHLSPFAQLVVDLDYDLNFLVHNVHYHSIIIEKNKKLDTDYLVDELLFSFMLYGYSLKLENTNIIFNIEKQLENHLINKKAETPTKVYYYLSQALSNKNESSYYYYVEILKLYGIEKDYIPLSEIKTPQLISIQLEALKLF